MIQLQQGNNLGARDENASVLPPAVSDIPRRLMRRFDVTILPEAKDKPRKLREIKAHGTLAFYFIKI